jgi:hypothetical protein
MKLTAGAIAGSEGATSVECGYEPSFAFTSALALAKSIWPA